MIILSQNCSKERLICIVKLFSDAWSSLTAVAEFLCILLHIVDVTSRAEAGPGLTCQLGYNDGAEDFLDTVVAHDACARSTRRPYRVLPQDPANIRINLTLPETRVTGLHPRRW